MTEMACQDFVELVTEYLEETMDDATRARFERHLDECPPCNRYLDQIRSTRQTLGRVELDTISDTARQRLLDAFRTWRNGEE
jgi:anti-sigma factor RsiW